MSSNDPWLNPFLDPVENRRCLTFNIISIKKRFLSKTILDNSFRLSYIDSLDSILRICKTSLLVHNLMTIVVGNKQNQNFPGETRNFFDTEVRVWFCSGTFSGFLVLVSVPGFKILELPG